MLRLGFEVEAQSQRGLKGSTAQYMGMPSATIGVYFLGRHNTGPNTCSVRLLAM